MLKQLAQGKHSANEVETQLGLCSNILFFCVLPLSALCYHCSLIENNS